MLGSGFDMRGGPMVIALFFYGVPSKLMQHQNCPNLIYFGVLLLWRHSYVWMFWPPNMHIYISSACWKQLFQLCWEMQISAGTLQVCLKHVLKRAMSSLVWGSLCFRDVPIGWSVMFNRKVSVRRITSSVMESHVWPSKFWCPII